jgi:hypothetical protein
MKVIDIKYVNDQLKNVYGISKGFINELIDIKTRLKTFDKLFNLMIVINVLLIICIALLTYEVSNLKG